MSAADAAAGVLWVCATLYAVFGGADFGAGFWALFAGAGQRGERARALVDWAIGPVWEANHVWLIFALVVLWTAFSVAFSSVMSTLFIPLSLAALGIVLRGSRLSSARGAAASKPMKASRQKTIPWKAGWIPLAPGMNTPHFTCLGADLNIPPWRDIPTRPASFCSATFPPKMCVSRWMKP